ncbi:MAG TPA: Yip1 family protein [Steroidobacteraceae bacterium]|nr:Yip1 family protein [Steroidobacteraceae bacterium]
MDLNKIIQRARALLVSPRTEWPVIAAEPATAQALYREYFMILAAIPPICEFVKVSILGYAWHGFRVYRLGIGAGLTAAIVQYVTSLAAVYVLAVIVEALAPNFAGQPNRIQALKVAGYSYTAVWIAGVALILPGLSGLVALAGALYSVYLLYLGLPSTMKVLPERATGYTAVIVLSGLVLGWIIAVITGGITGMPLSDTW